MTNTIFNPSFIKHIQLTNTVNQKHSFEIVVHVHTSFECWVLNQKNTQNPKILNHTHTHTHIKKKKSTVKRDKQVTQIQVMICTTYELHPRLKHTETGMLPETNPSFLRHIQLQSINVQLMNMPQKQCTNHETTK